MVSSSCTFHCSEMDAFLQRMVHRFHEQFFQRMPPERKARKLAVMKALAKSVKNKNKENEDPLNNNMALSYSFTHSTPMKNQQVTDLDDIESEMEPETEMTESELCGTEQSNEEEEASWREIQKPKLVISRIYDLSESRECEGSRITSDCQESECIEEGLTVLGSNKLDDNNGDDQCEPSVLHETAEYEFCRSLEQSKLFVSTSSLLEEIEADLPSPYSLAKPLNHTFHTLTSYRTQTRLARMDANLACPEILKPKECFETGILSKKIDYLEMDATVQKALAEQAEKALNLSKANKFLGVQHVESEKALLLANLRYVAVMQEAKKLRMLGETFEKNNFGQVTISDIFFEMNDSKYKCPGKYICTATENEHVQPTAVVADVIGGGLRFSESLKFQNLNKDFVIYLDLFKLQLKEPKKALLTAALVKKFKKMTAVNLNRSLTSSHSHCGFVCISQYELRLENIAKSENGKCVLQSYPSVNLQHPVAGNTVTLFAKTDVDLKFKQSGFLNAFQQTWHRRWYSQSGYFLEYWHYPEDQESDKPPVESIYLPNCRSVETVGLEVCIRPHSFVITLKENNEEILFSANSHRDMVTWIDHLNLILEQIRLWKPKI